MVLNHLHLMVSDASGAAAFLESYFDMRPFPGAREKFVVMGDERGMILTLMQAKDHAYPKHFHIGFGQADEASVNKLWLRMSDDGLAPSKPERAHAWSFYVRAPGGFLVEVLTP